MRWQGDIDAEVEVKSNARDGLDYVARQIMIIILSKILPSILLVKIYPLVTISNRCTSSLLPNVSAYQGTIYPIAPTSIAYEMAARSFEPSAYRGIGSDG